jgi:hypothetical protein
MRNLYVLYRASKLNDYPVPVDCIQQVIEKMARPKLLEASYRAFENGVNFRLTQQHINQNLPEFV